MSYFDPTIYCKQNLKEADRAEMERYQKLFNDVLNYTYERYSEDFCNEDSTMLDEVKLQIASTVIELAKDSLGRTLEDHMVGLIDSYEADVVIKEHAEPESFLYEPGDDEG